MKKYIFLLGFVLLSMISFGQIKVTSGNVNFRTSPEISSSKIGVIPKGSLVSLVKDTIEYSNWTKVCFNGDVGYVSSSFLSTIPSQTKSYTYTKSAPSNNGGIKYYTNCDGKKVQTPTHYKSAPAGATAICRDGTYSFSQHRRGTCSHHGGVSVWL